MTIELTKADKRLDAVRFLACVLPKSDNRFHTSHIKVEGDFGYSTDAARLHVAETALEDGYYKVHKLTKTKVLIEKVYNLNTNEGSYPDCTDLIITPEDKNDHRFNCIFNEDEPWSAYTIIIRAMSESTLNFNFVNDICKIVGKDVMDVFVPAPENNETCKPVHIVKNGFHAVLMPRKV